MAHSRSEFDELWRQWHDEKPGPKKQRLCTKLIQQNTPLVRKFVKRILRYTNVFVEEDDAMQAGLIGLLVALGKYDPNRPTRFSTMAWPWVRHEVSNMSQKLMQIYRPRGCGMPYKQFRESEAIHARTGRDATAAELGVPEKSLEKWRAVVFHFVPMNEVKEHSAEDNSGTYRDQDSMRDNKPIADEQMEEHETLVFLEEACKKTLSEIERRVLMGEEIVAKGVQPAIRDMAIKKVRAYLEDQYGIEFGSD